VRYLKAIWELLKLVEGDSEFKELMREFNNSDIPLRAVLFPSLGVDKSYWPNIYSRIHLQNKFYNSVEVQKVREIAHHITTIIDIMY
jgi:hypothetical protein